MKFLLKNFSLSVLFIFMLSCISHSASNEEEKKNEPRQISQEIVALESNIGSLSLKFKIDDERFERTRQSFVENVDKGTKTIGHVSTKMGELDSISRMTQFNNRDIKIVSPDKLQEWLIEKNIKINWTEMGKPEIEKALHATSTSEPKWDQSFSGTTPFSKSVQCSKQCCYSCGTFSCDKGACGYTISINESVPYKLTSSVVCKQNHHNCKCSDWTEILINFREVLKQNELFKKAHDTGGILRQELKEAELCLSQSKKEIDSTLVEIAKEKESLKGQSEQMQQSYKMALNLLKKKDSDNAVLVESFKAIEMEKQDLSKRTKEEVEQERKRQEEKLKKVDDLQTNALKLTEEKIEFKGKAENMEDKVRSLLGRVFPKLLKQLPDGLADKPEIQGYAEIIFNDEADSKSVIKTFEKFMNKYM